MVRRLAFLKIFIFMLMNLVLSAEIAGRYGSIESYCLRGNTSEQEKTEAGCKDSELSLNYHIHKLRRHKVNVKVNPASKSKQAANVALAAANSSAKQYDFFTFRLLQRDNGIGCPLLN